MSLGSQVAELELENRSLRERVKVLEDQPPPRAASGSERPGGMDEEWYPNDFMRDIGQPTNQYRAKKNADQANAIRLYAHALESKLAAMTKDYEDANSTAIENNIQRQNEYCRAEKAEREVATLSRQLDEAKARPTLDSIYGMSVDQVCVLKEACDLHDCQPVQFAKRFGEAVALGGELSRKLAASQRLANEAAAEREKYRLELVRSAKSLDRIYPRAGIWVSGMVESLVESQERLRAKLASLASAPASSSGALADKELRTDLEAARTWIQSALGRLTALEQRKESK